MLLRQTLRNTIFVLIITLVAALSGYAFRLLLARNMTVADYGLFYGMLSFFALFGIFVDIGITNSLARTIVGLYLKKAYEKINGLIVACFSLPFIISLILAMIFLSLYLPIPILKNYFNTSTTLPFLLFLIYFVTHPVDIILKSVFLGLQRVKTFSLIDPIKTGFSLIIAGVLFLFGYGMISPFIAFSAVNIFILILFIYPLTKTYPSLISEKYTFDKKIIKDVFIYGFFLALTNVSWAIIIHTDTLMILFFKDNVEAGLYQIAVPLAYTLLYLVTALNIVAYPLFAKLKETNDFNSLKGGITLLYDYLFIVMIPILFVFLLFPEIVIELLFGIKFLEAAPALRILAVGTLFNSLATFNIGFLTATGHAKSIVKVAIFTAISNILLNLIFVPKFGFVGAATATSISFAMLMILTTKLVHKFYPIVLPVRSWIVNVICGILTAGLIWYLKYTLNFNVWVELFLILLIAGLLYLFLLISTRTFVIKDAINLIKTTASIKIK